MGSCDNDNDDADDAENDNDNDNDKYRILHGRVGIRILSSRAENISHEWAKRNNAIKVVTYRKMPVTAMLWNSDMKL